jgi:ankyrin repeat protein
MLTAVDPGNNGFGRTEASQMSAELFLAVASGNEERVRELLASDPSAARSKDDEGATPLHYATLNGHRTIAQALLEQGADVNARDGRFGATPTGWAIEYLREAGGLLAIEIDDVLFAIRQKDAPWVRRFLTRLPTLAQARDAHGKPLSEHATESGNDEIARLFATALGRR